MLFLIKNNNFFKINSFLLEFGIKYNFLTLLYEKYFEESLIK